jgi:putative oxidoreductase
MFLVQTFLQIFTDSTQDCTMSIDKDTPATDWHADTSLSSVSRVFITDYLDLPARLLMSILFLMSGVGKLTAVAATQGYMEAYGVAGVLIWPAAALEIGGGLMLVLGLWARPLALVMAAWCLLTASIFHTKFSDPTQMVMFLKNLTMAGGFLVLAKSGTVYFSIDRVLARRNYARR